MELARCNECPQHFRGNHLSRRRFNPQLSGTPWAKAAVDITGKHPRSSRDYGYIVTVMDLFTKWVEAFPVRDHKATNVANILLENVFSRFGMPEELLSDQGAKFESELIAHLCSALEIKKIRTSPYRPSTNGALERFHRTLKQMIGKVVSATQRD